MLKSDLSLRLKYHSEHFPLMEKAILKSYDKEGQMVSEKSVSMWSAHNDNCWYVHLGEDLHGNECGVEIPLNIVERLYNKMLEDLEVA